MLVALGPRACLDELERLVFSSRKSSKPLIVRGRRINGSPRYALFVRDRMVCTHCGIVGQLLYLESWGAKPFLALYGVTAKGNEVLMTHDHIVPRIAGGVDGLENAACTCYPCNKRKGGAVPIDGRIFLPEKSGMWILTSAPSFTSREKFEDERNSIFDSVDLEEDEEEVA